MVSISDAEADVNTLTAPRSLWADPSLVPPWEFRQAKK